MREIVCLLKLIFKLPAFRNNKVFCLGGYYSTLLICRIFYPFLGKKFRLYIYNFYLHEAGEKKIIRIILRFLLNNPKCTLIVQSPKEVDFYKKLTTISIEFVPYCADFSSIGESTGLQIPPGDYIFTGGYTNRDYPIVLKCASAFPDQSFVIVAAHLNTEIKENDVPVNVKLFKDIRNSEFEMLLSHSKIVLVPLKSDVGASGQMLCVSAMQHKKPIVFSDISSINYYFKNYISGIPYPLGNEKILIDELSKLIPSSELQNKLGENAYKEYVDKFTPLHRDIQLFDILSKE
jgi:glycosyltransferase involved in cell wall biosynthesis